MSDDLPFRAEYAKSNRSSCKGCKSVISKDTLRVGRMIQSPHFDGKIPLWYHFTCFARTGKVKTTGDMAGFENLRWGDQEKIRKLVEENAAAEKEDDPGEGLTVQYCPKGGKCGGCSDKIHKNDLRIVQSESGKSTFYHLGCFANHRGSEGLNMDLKKLKGYNELTEEDKALVSEKLAQTYGLILFVAELFFSALSFLYSSFRMTLQFLSCSVVYFNN
ncbi:unnamed protein product [Soboliphyme baturini]|uniref:PARP-type domain-containing protein n=1 Tax=Soboliphyme baturini TaxID=241478 RepID=A0A183IV76_9BILA|nr:unnamed protein product [Soboliphyme baturini]